MTLTKWALVGAALFAAFAWAGKSDFVDSTVVEMKNNGTYYALSERFPTTLTPTWCATMWSTINEN